MRRRKQVFRRKSSLLLTSPPLPLPLPLPPCSTTASQKNTVTATVGPVHVSATSVTRVTTAVPVPPPTSATVVSATPRSTAPQTAPEAGNATTSRGRANAGNTGRERTARRSCAHPGRPSAHPATPGDALRARRLTLSTGVAPPGTSAGAARSTTPGAGGATQLSARSARTLC